MNVIMKLSFLILLASVVANAAPLQSTDDGTVPWHLDRIDQRSAHLDGKYNPFGNATGTGVDIYILAEGIDFDNEEFGGRALQGGFMPENDCSNYGTELASLAAGRNYGVAKNATIYSINLLPCEFRTNFVRMVLAIDFVIRMANNSGRRSVIAMPLTGSRSDNVNNFIEETVKKNIVVVTAAGQHGRDACGFSPGSSPHAINVGATKTEDGEDRLYPTSNFGPCVALYAPGESRSISSINRRRVSGTAQACAIVSGAAALVLEKYPHYTPAEVKQHLIDEATDGVINMESLRFMDRDKGTNKLLYVGNPIVIETGGSKPLSIKNGVITVKVGSTVYTVDGITIVIICNVIIGNPPITISWFRNGVLDQSRGNVTTINVTNTQLNVPTINVADTQPVVFTCRAENTKTFTQQDTIIQYASTRFCV